MIKLKAVEGQITYELDYFGCDCCHKKFYLEGETMFETQEFIHVNEIGGYGSIFGDGAEITGDFCQHCVKTLLGQYLRIGPDWVEKEIGKECLTKELKAPEKSEEPSFKCKHCGQRSFLRPDPGGESCDAIDEENRPYMCLYCIANRGI